MSNGINYEDWLKRADAGLLHGYEQVDIFNSWRFDRMNLLKEKKTFLIKTKKLLDWLEGFLWRNPYARRRVVKLSREIGEELKK